MADFIDKEYFIGTINLPKGEYDDILLFISQLEREILIYLLGYELYTLMKADVANAPYKALIEGVEYEVQDGGKTKKVKWNGFKNTELISFIAYYVYCYYIRNKVTSTQSVGETKSKQENSTNANIFAKITAASLKFEELYGFYGQNILIPSAYNFLSEHENDYPTWEFTDNQGLFNSHGL